MNIFELWGTIALRDDGFTRGINDAKNQTEGFASGIKGLISTVAGLTVVSKAFDAITGSIEGAIERYDTLNKFPRVLDLMGYSTTEAADATAKLRDGILGLPTSLNEIVASTQRLTSITGDLGLSVDTTLALNNAFLASGASASDASRGMIQYVQQLSKGKVDMISWRTLQETMGYALTETAEAFGFAGRSAQNDLYEALQSGNITFDQFNDKLIELSNATGGFAEMAKEAAGGIGTSWANMQIAIARGVASIIRTIDENLTANSLPNLQQSIEIVGKGFESFLGVIAKGAKDVITTFAPAVKFLSQNLDTVLAVIIPLTAGIIAFNVALSISKTIDSVQKSMLALNAVMSANPIALVVAGIAALAAGLEYFSSTLPKTTSKIKEQWQEIEKLTEAYDNNKKSIQDTLTAETARADSLSLLSDKLYELDKQVRSGTLGEEDYVKAKNEMKVISQQLTDAIPDLVIEFDNETGALKDQEGQIYKTIDAYVEMAKAKALSTAYSKGIEESTAQIIKLKKEISDLGEAPTYDTSTLEGRISQIMREGTLEWQMSRDMLEREMQNALKDQEYYLTESSNLMSKSMADTAKKTEKSITQTTEQRLESYDTNVKLLQRSLDRQEITELEFYQRMGGLRDEYLTQGSTDWEDATTDIIKFNNKMADESIKEQERLAKEQERMSKEQKRLQKENAKAFEQAEKDKFNASKKWIEFRKSIGLLSLKEEIEAWERVQSRYLEGTDERMEADKNLYAARQKLADNQKKLSDEMQKAEDKYTKAVDDRTKAIFNSYGLFEQLTKKEDKRKTALENATKAYKSAEKAVSDLQDKIAKTDDAEEAAELFEELTEKQKDLTQASKDRAAAEKEASKSAGKVLLENLKSQVDAMKNWAANLETLSAKGIDEGLLSELQAMGPGAADEIEALAKMTDKQLDEYSDLWGEKSKIAFEQASKEIEASPLKKETDELIKSLADEKLAMETGTTIGETIADSLGKALIAAKSGLYQDALSVANTIKSAFGVESAVSGSASGYATGLSYVPNDGLYKLHEGERVLTAAQNRAYTQGGETVTTEGANVVVNQYFYGVKEEKTAFELYRAAQAEQEAIFA